MVVNGTDTEDLESGPGLYTETTFPGIPGTTAIAGHRTTYLAPFRHIDFAANPGNQILLQMPYAHFTYTVIGQRVVAADATSRRRSRTIGYSAARAVRVHARCSAPPNACWCTRA